MEEVNEILINQDGDYAFSKTHEVTFSLGSKTTRNVPTPDIPLKIKFLSVALGPIAKWGDDNLFPQNVLCDARKNTIVASTLDWKARALYSGGLCYGELDYDEKGNETFIRKIDPVVEDFLRKSNIKNYLLQTTRDFYYFYNAFPEIVLSRDRSKIIQLAPQKAAYCRWGLQNDKTGVIEKCFINANWETIATASSPFTIERPVLDLYYDPAGALRDRSDSKNYIYPLSYPTGAESYYSLADWDTVRTSGWLEASTAISQFKKYLMENQMTVKYHIKIPESWWEWKFPEWKTSNSDTRNKIQAAEIDKFNKFLTGVKNTGKTLMTTFRFDPLTNKSYPGWEIIAIDDKLKSGIYIEDSQEASSHLLYALSVDATLIGSAPGKGMGAGSGSDKREAFNMYLSLCKIHEDMILDPFNLIRDYNGWNPKYVFRFNRPYLQMLSQITPAERNTSLPGNGGHPSK